MRRFYCSCGREVHFRNSLCHGCGRSLGYDPERGLLVALEECSAGWRSAVDGRVYRLCANRSEFGVCNAVVAADQVHDLCLACRLNRTIPDLGLPDNRERWAKLEQAKRRLVFGLLTLGLPLEAPVDGYPRGLCFDFLADRRSDPGVEPEVVTTGHSRGVITINLAEADAVQRVWQRESSGERYRTLLGHFRHEAGHYYFELLVRDRTGFVALFGDPVLPYAPALEGYYADGPLAGWERDHISAYASAHPLEDWAETFAHYLHLRDTLETGLTRRVIPPRAGDDGIDGMLVRWDELTVNLNELNRALGLDDAYPFVVTPTVARKLRFVHKAISDLTGQSDC